MAESSTWRYYLPSQHGNGNETFALSGNHAHYSISAEAAFEDYWSYHDGYELGMEFDYEVVLRAPSGIESRWMVRAEMTVAYSAERKET